MRRILIKEVDPVKKGWGIQGFRVGREGVFVEVREKENIKEMEGDVDLREKGFKVEEVRRRAPWIVVFDIPIEQEEEGVMERLREIAEKGKEDFQKICKVKVVRRFGSKKNMVVEVNPEIRMKLLKEGRCRIGWVSCKVEDFAEAPQCFRCFGFGHMARRCREVVHCAKCGGKGHIERDCKEEKGVCINCRSEGHLSRSKECPVYKAALKAWVKSIDYGN